jgi:hypothetical protein
MVSYVYRRPHDYRAPSSIRRLLFPPQLSQVATYRGPLRLIYSGGVFRQGYTVVPLQPFYLPTVDSFGGNSSLSFAATGTLSGSSDPTAIIVAFSRIAKERARWHRERWDDSPIRAINPIFSSQHPTGAALLSFSATGTMLAVTAGEMFGSTSLTFNATANTSGVSLISGQATLSFDAYSVQPNTVLIAGSTSLTFTLPDVNVPTLQGSTSLTFSASGIVERRIKRISMVISHPRIQMEIL